MLNSEKRKLIERHYGVSKQRVHQMVKDYAIDLDLYESKEEVGQLIAWIDALRSLQAGEIKHCKVPWHLCNMFDVPMKIFAAQLHRIDRLDRLTFPPSGRYALYTDDVREIVESLPASPARPFYSTAAASMAAKGKHIKDIATALDKTAFDVRAAAFNEPNGGKGTTGKFVPHDVQRAVLNHYMASGRFVDAMRASGLSLYMVKRVISAHGKMLRKHKKGAR